MSTPQSVENQLQALIDQANAKTGNEDTDLTTAVGTLVNGYSSENWYDTFWDSYQDYGERLGYAYSFYGKGWNDTTFKPKYPIKWTDNKATGTNVDNIDDIFSNSLITDLSKLLKENGMPTIDLTFARSVSRFIQYSAITKIPPVIIGARTETANMFYYAQKLEIIEELDLNESNNYPFTFTQCTALQEINVSGVIKKSINLQYSPNITTEDAINTILHLGNLYGTSDEFNQTLTFHADVWARLDALGAVVEDPTMDDPPAYIMWKDYPACFGWNVA